MMGELIRVKFGIECVEVRGRRFKREESTPTVAAELFGAFSHLFWLFYSRSIQSFFAIIFGWSVTAAFLLPAERDYTYRGARLLRCRRPRA
jgi:hypothetical protein